MRITYRNGRVEVFGCCYRIVVEGDRMRLFDAAGPVYSRSFSDVQSIEHSEAIPERRGKSLVGLTIPDRGFLGV